MDEDKQEHINLAGIIKNTHAKLRKQFQSNTGDLDKIWKDHCSNKELLSKYADAMHSLAVKHWSKLPQTRVDWCVATLLEYFHGGGLEKAMKKEQRRLFFEKLKKESECTSDAVSNCKEVTLAPSSSEEISENQLQSSVKLSQEDKIRILDVGSCFNPFSCYEQLLSVGIDICPATPNVLSCDFLHLEISDSVPENTAEAFLEKLNGPVTKLPRQCFHSIVFSLLLEYLPSPQQRWLCCTQARELLTDNGLLLIVTPDSHKQHRNAHMIKSWKTAIEAIGFVRWRYVKLKHLHCLAFRKVDTQDLSSNVTPDMLYIHQDFKEEQEEDTKPYGAEDENFFLKTLKDLPNFDE